MKVMYLLEYPIDLPGGAQMSTHSLCEGLLATPIHPIVVCPKLLSKKKGDFSFRILEYPMGEKRIPNLLMRIKAFYHIIKKERPDIIHIQMPESLITFGFLRCMGFFKRSKLIYTDRGLYYGYRSHSMTLMKLTLNHAYKILCTTKFNQNLWIANSRFQDIEVISNTISQIFETYSEERRTTIRREKGLLHEDGTEDFVLGFAGRVCEEKNWPVVKELIKSIKEAGIQLKVSIVMSVFEPGDMEVVEDVLTSLKSTLGEPNVLYYQDLSQAQMADYYYEVDVFVMTSRFESFGKAAVEAMSRKCAVVSTAVGGLAEVVGKKENLYAAEYMESGVSYIGKLYKDKTMLLKDKDYFYNRYKENYTQAKCLKDHIGLYQGCIEKT